MKNLVLGAVCMAGLLQAGTGCIISSDDDDDGISDGDGSGDGLLYRANFDCPPDADTIRITATPTNSGSSHPPEDFACDDGFGEILFDPGTYDVDLEPLGPAGVDFLILTDTIVGGDGDLVEDTYEFPQDVGFFFLTWTIEGEDPAAGCADFASAGLSVVSTLIGPDTATDDIFDCDAGEGTTSELDLGDYAVQVTILDENENVLGASEPFPAALDFGAQVSDLGNLDVVVE